MTRLVTTHHELEVSKKRMEGGMYIPPSILFFEFSSSVNNYGDFD